MANSATDAIMWLKRGLTFVKEFLKNVAQGEQDLTKALQDAYTTSLWGRQSFNFRTKDLIRTLQADFSPANWPV